MVPSVLPDYPLPSEWYTRWYTRDVCDLARLHTQLFAGIRGMASGPATTAAIETTIDDIGLREKVPCVVVYVHASDSV